MKRSYTLFKDRWSNDITTDVKMTSPEVSLRDEIMGRPDYDRLYVKIPLTVVIDRTLKRGDLMTYIILVHISYPGNYCRQSLRKLASIMSTDMRQVHRSMTRLIEGGHVRRTEGILTLTSPVFAPKVQSEGKRRGACLVCARVMNSIPKGGVCRSCAAQAETERFVADTLAKNPAISDEELHVAHGSRKNKSLRLAILKWRMKSKVASIA